VVPGRAVYELRAESLGPGVYFLRASLGEMREALRVSVIH
jgi:hypothetical protein